MDQTYVEILFPVTFRGSSGVEESVVVDIDKNSDCGFRSSWLMHVLDAMRLISPCTAKGHGMAVCHKPLC